MRIGLLLIILLVVGCQSDRNRNTVEYDVGDTSNIGNIRMSFIDKNKKSTFTIINKKNTQYLAINKIIQENPEFNSMDRDELPSSAFDYNGKYLTPSFTSSVTLVENGVMAQMLALATQMQFYKHATTIKYDDLGKQFWPESPCFLIEKDGNLYIVQRDDKLNTDKGKAYLAMKTNLFRAPGDPIISAQTNVDGAQLMRQGINSMKQNTQKLKNKGN